MPRRERLSATRGSCRRWRSRTRPLLQAVASATNEWLLRGIGRNGKDGPGRNKFLRLVREGSPEANTLRLGQAIRHGDDYWHEGGYVMSIGVKRSETVGTA